MRLLLLFALLATFVGSGCSKQPEHEVWAVVISIAPHSNPKFYPDELVVTAKSQQGIMGMKSVLATQLNCQVGDTVRAKARGLALELDARACKR
jgi:hypothetical protein